MKYILLFLTIIISSYTFSQKNSKYIDSLQKIINKGFYHGEDFKKGAISQCNFLKACGPLGDYYKSIHNIKKALHYYFAAINIDSHALDEWGKYLPFKIQGQLCLKVGDLYLNNKNIRDSTKALAYHTLGIFNGNANRADYYSKLYFHSTRYILNIEKIDNLNGDTSTIFSINPFAFIRKISQKELSKVLREIKFTIKQDSSLNCLLQMEAGDQFPHGELGFQILYRFLKDIKIKIDKENIINSQKISLNVDYNSCCGYYKSFHLPFLEVKFSKEKN